MKTTLPSWILTLMLYCMFSPSLVQAQKSDVMLEGFYWDSYNDNYIQLSGGLYNYLNTRMANFKESGRCGSQPSIRI